jgi:hypothetical protein
MINNFKTSQEMEFFYDTFPCIAIRAFIEIMDNNGIDIDIFNTECIFELDFDQNIFDQIYEKIDDIYRDGIANKTLDVDLICHKCGIFGHSHQSRQCLLFNENYEMYIVKANVDEVMNSLVSRIERTDLAEKRQAERLKRLCKSCNHNLFSNKCEHKMCRCCCSCDAHQEKIYNKGKANNKGKAKTKEKLITKEKVKKK